MIWTERSGTKLAVLNEGKTVNINLPINNSPEITLIGGELPTGLSLVGTTLQGIVAEVARTTTYRFVLRAKIENVISDRTFQIEIEGADEPVWQTPADLLPVGKNETFYILDSSPVDFQLQATDTDIAAGQNLKYFIASGDGELPPGISLTESGRLIGVVDPILALEKEAGSGNFDENRYDKFPYDFAIKKLGGLESFFYQGETQEEKQNYALENNLGYDSRPYDFSTPIRTPKKLNRYFQFTISVSDGDTIAKRTFRIFVVGDDFLRADNTIMQVGTGIFTADNTFIRTPIWLTPGNLGFRRANNFITLFLDVIDPNTITGLVTYELLSENNDGTVSELPPGTELDPNTGEIFGRVPYQPAVTKEYRFSVRASRFTTGTTETASSDKTFTINLLGEIDSTIKWLTDSDLGTVESNYVSTLFVKAETSVPNSFLLYTIQSGTLPPGLELAFNGEIIGRIDNAAVETTSNYQFRVKARDQFGFSAIERNFSLTVENIDDTLYTDVYYKPLLPPNQRRDYYNFISDPQIFPPDAIYRPSDPRFGLQQNPRILAYAGIERKSVENFAAAASRYAKRKTFSIDTVKKAEARLPGTNTVLYEVVYLDLFDRYEKDGEVKKQLKISDFEEITADIIKTTPNNPRHDTTRLSSITIATRKNPSLKYYYEPFIELETRSGNIAIQEDNESIVTRHGEISFAGEIGSSTNIFYRPKYENTITADSSNIKVSDPKRNTKYITNTTNLEEDLIEIGKTDRSFLPLWMRSPQPGQSQELGYTLAIPLAYCLPGQGDRILSGIRVSQVDFRKFEFEIDRFVIENDKNSQDEKYVLFSNYEYQV
jgi:hypothetical protein